MPKRKSLEQQALDLSDACFGRLMRIGDLLASDIIHNPSAAITKLETVLEELPDEYQPIRMHLLARLRSIRLAV